MDFTCFHTCGLSPGNPGSSYRSVHPGLTGLLKLLLGVSSGGSHVSVSVCVIDW